MKAVVKTVLSGLIAASVLSGCISSSSPPAPEKNTTVVVPPGNSGTTVVCQDGTKPPCR